METAQNGQARAVKPPILNGNSHGGPTKRKNGAIASVKDKIVTNDGRVFYPCQFCNKVFPIKKSRTFHIKKCPAKEYILSVEDLPATDTQEQEETAPPKESPATGHCQEKEELQLPAGEAPIPKPQKKIDIQQNIVLNKQMDVSELLSKAPPIKLTIRRIMNSDSTNSVNFTVSNSVVLKEKHEPNNDIIAITKRLQGNAVTLTKQIGANNVPAPISKEVQQTKEVEQEQAEAKTEEEQNSDGELSETACRTCKKEFKSPLELLRHGRKCHSYPKVMMALSEVKKFYSLKDRSACPICNKPLRTNFRSAYVKHLLTHTKEMKYSCHVCRKKFRRVDHMRAHEKRHIN